MPAAVREVTSKPERRTPTLGTSGGEPAKMAGKKRVRNFTADDRATHRIFEKNRREAFKGRLTVGLTESLQSSLIYCAPLSSTDPRRLSKHVVVEESIARHKLMKSLCSDAFQDIRALVQERDELLAQVNHRRLIDGLAPQAAKAVNLHIDRLQLRVTNGRFRVYAYFNIPRNSGARSGNHSPRPFLGCDAPGVDFPHDHIALTRFTIIRDTGSLANLRRNFFLCSSHSRRPFPGL
ncbi:predicted protein [Verticillium alfalfae VaMs.102]|uniref:Predicted protein n=1 Tax=Verticillium alfalfae (strain VaMs.102 / ATCC MYA-4576 / FGSC 10136) TaxID=526221 RepID=C9SIU7_VERA1|nr:predicted protein [Verticillium alfalfae VaMs.102]EEY18870.1 predicted protein [Verticillium alfalfae VaMs.102]